MPSTLPPDRAEQDLIGRALSNLRERAGLYQRDVAAPLGISTQAWQKYEAGERRFSAERLAEVLRIIGATDDDLEIEKGRITGVAQVRGVAERRTDFVFDVHGRTRTGASGPEVYDVGEPTRRIDLRQIIGPRTQALEVAGDAMSPWAESGEVILYDLDRYPRRGHGCVVEMTDGSAYVKLYEKSDGATLFVRELFPEDRTIPLKLAEVKGVYAVRLRGD